MLFIFDKFCSNLSQAILSSLLNGVVIGGYTPAKLSFLLPDVENFIDAEVMMVDDNRCILFFLKKKKFNCVRVLPNSLKWFYIQTTNLTKKQLKCYVTFLTFTQQVEETLSTRIIVELGVFMFWNFLIIQGRR